jgi:hypothetical protein
LAVEVEIERTHDNTGVVWVCEMQLHEVSTVQRNDRPLISCSHLEDSLVAERLAGRTGIGDGDHVVPDSPQRFDDGERKVLVSE